MKEKRGEVVLGHDRSQATDRTDLCEVRDCTRRVPGTLYAQDARPPSSRDTPGEMSAAALLPDALRCSGVRLRERYQ
jgi:hypothetical protein